MATRFPFGVDFIYQLLTNRQGVFWPSKSKPSLGAREMQPLPATVEVILGMSTRFIFTTDPENIKAILSTRFADYIDSGVFSPATRLEMYSEPGLKLLARFTRDPRILRDQLLAMIIAGPETTASTLTFCLFELSRNPEVVNKLRSEIHSRLGVRSEGRKPTYTDLKVMKYLNASSMKLFVCILPYHLTAALPYMTPLSHVAAVQTVSRPADLYPARGHHYFDPLKWLPERWISGWEPEPWQFIPFSGGPRVCIGNKFAIIDIGYTITRILQEYEQIVALPATGKETVEDPVLRFGGVSLKPSSEMNCVFIREGAGNKGAENWHL
ncbi:hypothetical protein VTN00DRAFT_4758 [Thermoascus crustaceus]|uniref:uncharacterized protein n=1 Tax=Thermoascus crustaceus TaxID=5088 RepID=UPI003742ADDA